MTTEFINFYKVLQVDPSAETEVIDAAWKKLAFKYHPDKNKTSDAEENMKLLNMAKDILLNPERRREYDKQFAKASQAPESYSASGSSGQETVDEDDWVEQEIRDMASQFLRYIRQALNEKKWRIAREKLYVFDGLGTQPEGYGVLPRFDSSIPEWKEAKRLNDLANQQASSFGIGIAIASSLIYAFGVSFIAFFFGLFSYSDLETGFVYGLIIAIIGFGIGIVAGLIGTIVYSIFYAGKWGRIWDVTLGLLTPLIIALLLSFGLFLIAAWIFIGVLGAGLSSQSKK